MAQQPLPPWGNALAGATGALIANAIVYPLDVYIFVHLCGTPRLTIKQR